MNKPSKARPPVQLALGAIGAVLVVLGLMRGEFAVTWNKAALICLECIGIG